MRQAKRQSHRRIQSLTPSHSLATRLGSIKERKTRRGGNNNSSTDFLCLYGFGKVMAVHRIGWRAGIHGRHRIPQETTEGRFSVMRGNMAVLFFFSFFLEITSSGWMSLG